jgi:hypothetical protein
MADTVTSIYLTRDTVARVENMEPDNIGRVDIGMITPTGVFEAAVSVVCSPRVGSEQLHRLADALTAAAELMDMNPGGPLRVRDTEGADQ